MAITFVMIDFDKPVAKENEDILNHLGFLREIAGQTDLNFVPHMWDLALDELGFQVHGTIFRLLSDRHAVPYLTVIFENGLPKERHGDELFVRRRSTEIGKVIAWMMVNMGLKFGLSDIKTFSNDNDIVYEIRCDLSPMLKGMLDVRRGAFGVVKDE